MRTLVDIPGPDLEALDRLSRRRHVSRARVIREALSDYLARNAPGAMDEAFGLWSETPVDGLEYQRRIRQEW